ncbi:hypothetical protein FRB93_006501 [Tulasnella sp. JGI-2019a]|nr:hypothetical protein FRB93_006501 [Tulasnella sp. JGI-2019a]
MDQDNNDLDHSPTPSQPLTPLDLAHTQHQRRAAAEQGQIIDPNDYQPEHGEDSAEAGAAGAKRSRPVPAKTFQCRGFGECRMVFSRSEHLARHIRKHTGERPFSCHCGKQFSRLDNLRQHAQTVHSDKHTENEIMMRELTSLHTQLAAKTSKVNRDVYTTAGGESKRRGGASDAGSSGGNGARAGGVAGPGSYDAHAVGPYGPPGMAYHQVPPGYPHPPHPGYPMLPPPGQYDGYHPGYYPPPPQVSAQGQPYPSYPPSFGPPHGVVYPGGSVGYAPYPQAQYPPVSPGGQYRNGAMVYPDPTQSPDPNTPLTPNSTTPLSANSGAGHSFLGSSEPSSAASQSSAQHHQHHQGGNGSFLGQRGGSPGEQQQQHQHPHDPRAFTDGEGHLVPPPASGGGHPHGNHSFRNQQHGQQLHSPIPVSPVSVHSSNYDDANGSDADGGGSGINGDVISGGPDTNGRSYGNGNGHGEQQHDAASGFDQPQSPYVVVNGHGQPSGFEGGGGPGDDDGGSSPANGAGSATTGSSSVNNVEQGFRQRGAGWESGFRNSTATSRDNHNKGDVDVGRVRAGSGSRGDRDGGAPGGVAVGSGVALGFGDRSTAADSGVTKREGFAADPKSEVSSRHPGTSGQHGGQQHQSQHGKHGHGHGSSPAQSHVRKSASSHQQQSRDAGHSSSAGVQQEGVIPPQHWRGQHQSRGSDAHPRHASHSGGFGGSPPDLVSATGGEAGPFPPLSAVVPHRSSYGKQYEYDSQPHRRVYTNVPDHAVTRDGHHPSKSAVESEYGRPGTAPAAYIDARGGPRPSLSRGGSRGGREGLGVSGGLPDGGSGRLGYDSIVHGGDRDRRLPPATASSGTRVGSGPIPTFQPLPGNHSLIGSGKHSVYASPSSESPFSFHPPDVPIDDHNAGHQQSHQQHSLSLLHVYRPTSGRPFSGVSSVGGESSVPSSSYGRPSTSGGSVFGGSGRPFSSSSGLGYGHVGQHQREQHRFGVRPGTATSTTDPASYAFSRGTKRPHTADSSDGSSVTGGRDSPFKYGGVGGRERGSGFDYERDRPPSTAATDDRPPSRRLSLMELCTPPASSSGRPGTASGRGASFGTLGPAFRPSTSDGRWAGKTVVEESDNGSSGDVESLATDAGGEQKSSATTSNVPSSTSTDDGDVRTAIKSAPADIHTSSDSVVRVPHASPGSGDISRSTAAEVSARSHDISTGKEHVQSHDRTVDRTGSPTGPVVVRADVPRSPPTAHTPSRQPSRANSQSTPSADDDRTSAALPLPIPVSAHVGGVSNEPPIGVQQQQQFQLPSRPQSVLSTASGDTSPAVNRAPTPAAAAAGQHARAVHTAKPDTKAAISFKTTSDSSGMRSGSSESRISIVSSTPRTATPSIGAEVSRASSSASARHHELTGSPGLLQA